MKEKKRDYSGDLLRILLIIIIIHHSLVHGLGLAQLRNETSITQFPIYFFALNSFGVMAVNAFFFVSGYYGIKRNIKRIIDLYMQCVFYALVWNVITIIGDGKISLHVILNVIFPIRDYWFMAVYFVLVLLAPYIKTLFDNLDNNQRLFIVIVVTSVNVVYGFVFNFVGVGDGYTLFQGFNLYFIGLYCSYNKESLFKKRKIFGLTGIICVFIEFGLTYFTYLKGFSSRAWHLFAYNNPIVVMMAVSFCILLLNLGWKRNNATMMITQISSCSLAAYLLTDNMYAKKIVFCPLIELMNLSESTIVQFCEIIVYALILTIICVLIDIVRAKCTQFIYMRFKR